MGFINKGIVTKPAIREVVFLDTADFRLYNNAFILRQRIASEFGFPTGEPEIVFKFRHDDMQKAAALDVRPNIAGNYRNQIQGRGSTAERPNRWLSVVVLSQRAVPLEPGTRGRLGIDGNFGARFPGLETLKTSETDRVELVNQTIVEEVLQDLGALDFGKGNTADANVSIWRERGTHHPLCGEFAFQAKFKRRDDVHDKVINRCQQFFIALQQSAYDWLFLGTTKTGLVYQLKGNPPQSHE